MTRNHVTMHSSLILYTDGGITKASTSYGADQSNPDATRKRGFCVELGTLTATRSDSDQPTRVRVSYTATVFRHGKPVGSGSSAHSHEMAVHFAVMNWRAWRNARNGRPPVGWEVSR